MAKIKSKNTQPELRLRKCLWSRGRRGYRIHNKNLPGKPDIAFPSRKTAIFIDGCFWHHCPECYSEPKSNKDYWLPKIQRNVERDRRNQTALEEMGWTVIRIWEHEIDKNLAEVCSRLEEILSK
jgi:DNA mismatch endonuclease (patch repair protein)